MRTTLQHTINNQNELKQQLLAWSQQHREIVFLDSNNYPDRYSNHDCILAVDAFTSIKTDYHNAFEDLKQYQQTTKDWIFGYLSYDLKNNLENLSSNNFDGLQFDDLYFFQPKKLFFLKDNVLEMSYLNFCDDELKSDYNDIVLQEISEPKTSQPLKIQQRISEEEYLSKASTILQHIGRGDFYEANFCHEFYAENASINPLSIFNKLNAISRSPMAVFFKNNQHYLLSASPERYLKKTGDQIISQPIKGTSKRYLDAVADQKSKNELRTNPKERAENIMVTDLVRNDLSHTAQKGSVEVQELCAIYSFLQVHQMITTVSSTQKPEFSPVDVIKTTFPMGSMTGMPKISVMKIIEQLEETKRGLYSGSVGYFTPNGDFDFNVVIRSILYNQANKYVSFSVGSAITALSKPEEEYQECLLKAKAMLEVLG